jgi:WD40 repeat protein
MCCWRQRMLQGPQDDHSDFGISYADEFATRWAEPLHFVRALGDIGEVSPENGETERAREGVRAWVGRLSEGARWTTPRGLLAVLCASTLMPIVGAASVPAAGIAGLTLLGSVGGNVLAELVMRFTDRMRSGDEPSFDDLVRLIERELAPDGARAGPLLTEISRVLAEVDAVGTALSAAMDFENAEVQALLTTGFAMLGAEFTEFRFLLVEVRENTERLQTAVRDQASGQEADRERTRRHGAQLGLILDQLSVIEQRTRRTGDAGPDPRPRWPDGCPYQGLLPFQEDHAEVFYGREAATAELVSRLAVPGLVVLTGASGSGKSSLLRAGFLPALAKGVQLPGSADWPTVVMTPTDEPMAELAVRLAALSHADSPLLRNTLVQQPEEIVSAIRQAALTETGGRSEHLVLVIDQFEELFTLTEDHAQREAFIQALQHATASAYVVLAIRGDFWDRCMEYPVLAEVLRRGPMALEAMAEAELRSAIVGPANAAHLDLENGLVTTILEELRSAETFEVGVQPLLSQAMRATWERRDGGLLTLRGYNEAGGVREAVRSSAERAFGALTESQQELAGQLFRRMATINRDGLAVRRPFRASNELDTEAEAVLGILVRERLVIRYERVTEISHDVLLHAWPRLRAWLEDNRSDQILFVHLADDAEEWQSKDQDASFLYRGKQLAAVQEAASRRAPELDMDAIATDFLIASQRAAASARRWRVLVRVSLTALLAAALVAALLASKSAVEANQQKDIALSRQLAAQSDSLRDTDIVLAAKLATLAWKISPTIEARFSLLNVLSSGAKATISAFRDDNVDDVAFDRTGETLAAAASHGGVQLWNVATRRMIGSVSAEAHIIEFSPDGHLLAFDDGKVGVHLWDVSTRRDLALLKGHTNLVQAITFSTDSGTLATGAQDGTVRLWDVKSHRQLGPPIVARAHHGDGSGGIVTSVAFSPNGRMLATATIAEPVRVWDVRSHNKIGSFAETAGAEAAAVAFSPDGKFIAGAQGDRVRLWDVKSRRETGRPFSGHTNSVDMIVFSPKGTTLATAGQDGTVRLWDVETKQQMGASLPGNDALRTGLAFTPDGRTLAAGLNTGVVRLWDVSTRYQADPPVPCFPPSGLGKPTKSADLAHLASTLDGRKLAVLCTSGEGTGNIVQLLDTADWKHSTKPLDVGGDDMAALSPTGNLLATASSGSSEVHLWDTGTSRQLGGVLIRPAPFAAGLAFNHDGSRLIVGGTDDFVHLWDIRRRRELAKFDCRSPMASDPENDDGLAAVAVSSDDHLLACADYKGTLYLWDNWSNKRFTVSTGNWLGLNIVVFSPDNTKIAVGGEDHTVKVWDTRTHHQVASLNGHKEAVYSIAFSPDGALLATGTEEPALRLWDLTSGRQFGEPIYQNIDIPYSLAFTPDARKLVAAGNRIHFWNVAIPKDRYAAVCEIAGGPLSRLEWDQFVTGTDYIASC